VSPTRAPSLTPTSSPSSVAEYCAENNGAILAYDSVFDAQHKLWIEKTGNGNNVPVHYNATTDSVYFNGSQLVYFENIDISPVAFPDLTIEIWFQMRGKSNDNYLLGLGDPAFERSILLSDSRYGGIGQGVGEIYDSTLETPTMCEYHQLIAVFGQHESFLVIDGVVGTKFTLTQSSSIQRKQFTLGGLPGESRHNFIGDIKSLRMYNYAMPDVSETFNKYLYCAPDPTPCAEVMPSSTAIGSKMIFEPIAVVSWNSHDTFFEFEKLYQRIKNMLLEPHFPSDSKYFAGIKNFQVTWEERLEVPASICSDEDMAFEYTSIRCGTIPECTTTVETSTTLVTQIHIDDYESALLFDALQTSPSEFGNRLMPLFANSVCLSSYTEISFYGRFRISISPSLKTTSNQQIQEFQHTLQANNNIGDSFYGTDFQMDVCSNRTCSDRGTCCAATDLSCPIDKIGLCVCDIGFEGYDCSKSITTRSIETSRACVTIPGSWVDFSTICNQPNACKTHRTICAYFDELKTSSVTDSDACADGEWVVVFQQEGCSVGVDFGAATINRIFKVNKLWKYEFVPASDDPSPYTTLYYKYIGSTFPANYSAYGIMIDDFSDLNGLHLINEQFELYETIDDLVSESNKWNWAGYNRHTPSIRGFPTGCMPLADASNSYTKDYYRRWAKGYCRNNIVPFIPSFKFSLCIPNANQQQVQNIQRSVQQLQEDEEPVISISGTVSNIASLNGVDGALVLLIRGRIETWNDDDEIFRQTTTVSASANAAKGQPDCSIDNQASTISSTFAIDNVVPGFYTVVVIYEKYHTELTYVQVPLTNQLDIQLVPKLDNSSLLMVFETESLELDFVAQFSESQSECVISSKLLVDGACGCKGASLVRSDTVLNQQGKAYQVIYIDNILSTVYQFYLSRSKPLLESASYIKHRSDGRCGDAYPLKNGESAQCPPVPVVWGDGTLDLRPCCNLQRGYCGLTDTFCKSRYSIDFRRFLSNSWTQDTIGGLQCNIPNLLSESGHLATCPEDKPCCGPNARCGNLEYHCNSQYSIDYREFYAQGNSTTSSSYVAPVELSHSVVSLFIGSERSSVMKLPDPADTINYFDGHTYTGLSSLSSSYVRSFCIDSRESLLVHEHPAPRYFQYKGQMLSMSTTCPGTGECSYVSISNLLNSRLSKEKVLVLNGKYIKQSTAGQAFKARPGYWLNRNSDCRIAVLNSNTGQSRWVFNDETAADCLSFCEASESCELVAMYEWLDGSTQQFRQQCSFHANNHLCGGIYAEKGLNKWIYTKQTTFSHALSYVKLETMFNPSQRVYLYRDDSTNRWYFDNDTFPSTGILAASQVSSMDVPPTTGWQTLISEVMVTQQQPIKVTVASDDCLVGGLYPTLNGTMEKVGCNCSSSCENVSCASFKLRMAATDLCLEAQVDDLSLIVNMCEENSMEQSFIFNRNKRQLELSLSSGHYVVVVRNNEFKLQFVGGLSENQYYKAEDRSNERRVGGFGGTCTCPDGQVYNVGDYWDNCGSLACEGGVSSACDPNKENSRLGMMVRCGSTFETENTELSMSSEGYICNILQTPPSSYSESLIDRRICLFAPKIPSSKVPVLVSAADLLHDNSGENWPSFQVL